MTIMKKTIASLLLSGIVPLSLLGLAACTQQAAAPGGETSTAQMEHSSSDSHAMSMEHGSTMSMDLGPADENFDLRFIDAMIPHHEGAVAMAETALQNSNRPEIKQLAQEIIAAQQQEISELQAWRSAWYPNAGDEPMMYSAEMGHMMPMSEAMRSSMRMDGDLGAADDQFDLRFIEAMIPHHEGAIDMAEQALEKSDRPEIKTLAQNIMDSQQREIDQMKQWKQEWY